MMLPNGTVFLNWRIQMNRPTVRQRSLGACMNPAAQAAVLKNPRVDESNGLADQPRTLFAYKTRDSRHRDRGNLNRSGLSQNDSGFNFYSTPQNAQVLGFTDERHSRSQKSSERPPALEKPLFASFGFINSCFYRA
ncbi:MAG TPA: hypothetical protein PKJ00_14410 [Verrucomicrobiota bacterium]|nr:hypothetical protein [Verrucomicrobiota bacterium]